MQKPGNRVASGAREQGFVRGIILYICKYTHLIYIYLYLWDFHHMYVSQNKRK